MTSKNILFSSNFTQNIMQKAEQFNSIFTAMDKPTEGCIISFLLDEFNRIVGYELHDSKLNGIFFGPSNPCVWYTDGKDVYAEEQLPLSSVIKRMFRRLHANRNSDKLLTAILNGMDITQKNINYYTASLFNNISPFFQQEVKREETTIH